MKATLRLLPEAAKNLEELRKMSQAAAEKLMNLGKEWEQHRAPLVAKFRRQKQLLVERKDEVGTKVGLIQQMRKDMKEKLNDLRDKEKIYQQVLDELNKLPKSINRQVYVDRIMDVVKNLERQKVDIKKILEDVRRVQKDINATSETSKRSFAVADEVVYQAAAKKDAFAIQSYKNVVTLREGFDQLVASVEDTGKHKNETREMGARIDVIESRNTALNMERVEKDLDQVKKENKAMVGKLKQLNPSLVGAGE